MKKIDWIKLIKAVGIAIMLMAGALFIGWLYRICPYAIYGLIGYVLLLCIYSLIPDKKGKDEDRRFEEVKREYDESRRRYWEEKNHE